jgi:hypothetical protein
MRPSARDRQRLPFGKVLVHALASPLRAAFACGVNYSAAFFAPLLRVVNKHNSKFRVLESFRRGGVVCGVAAHAHGFAQRTSVARTFHGRVFKQKDDIRHQLLVRKTECSELRRGSDVCASMT